MLWCDRPSAWPAWNARHRRVLRFWSASDDLEDAIIESLRSATPVEVAEPSATAVREQLLEERRVGAAHLRRTVDDDGEPQWRRGHRGGEAEDHLWRAAAGLIEIENALAELPA